MKIQNTFVIVIGIFIFAVCSCKKDSDKTSNGALSGNTLKGKITSWNSGSDKTLVAYSSSSTNKLGEAAIGTDGSFTITISVPSTSILESITYYFDTKLTISDLTTLCNDLDLNVNDAAGNYYGYISRSADIPVYQKGYSSVDYLYVNKDTSVKGSLSESDSGETDNGTFDLKLKTGWNPVVTLVTSITGTTNTMIVNYTITSSEPSGMKWVFSTGKK